MKKKIKSSNIDSESGLDYSLVKSFMHCAHCMEQFLGSPLHDVMTPGEYGLYEASRYPFTYSDGTHADIVVVWCKRCGRSVWDSR